jgi:hypothetical protein
MRGKIFTLFFMAIQLNCLAQGPYTLKIVLADKDSSFFKRDFSYKSLFPDTLARNAELKNFLFRCYEEGYLEASYRDFQKDSLSETAIIFIGNKWEWLHLRNGNVDDVILDRIGFKERLYSGKPVNYTQVNGLLNDILIYCENNGYPFAVVRLDSLKAVDGILSAGIFLNKNKLITVDSILTKGSAKIANRYLGNYLGLRTPTIYKEDVILKIGTRLKELPFLTEERPTQLVFNDNRVNIILNLKKRNASNFDFLLGVLPNSSSTGKLLVTGDGQLNLNNPFGAGESLNFRFSQLPGRTTQVMLKAAYPYLFGLPFGIDGEFHLYKNDTLYLDVKGQIGFQYLFTGTNYIKVFFKNASTSILSIDTNTVIQTRQLPSYLDMNTKFYGSEYKFEKVDYRLNPTKGWSVFVNGQAGTRTIKENAKIVGLSDPGDPSFSFSSLYDSLDSKQTQYQLTGSIDAYWPLSRRSSFKTSYHGGHIISSQIFFNELYRIGGFQLLRGFDEASLFVSQYHIITLEYHYALGQNSYTYLFFDAGYIENKSAVPFYSDVPIGFGAGFNFETKAGIFGVSYALGSRQGNPVEFRAAKIHFGYINYF